MRLLLVEDDPLLGDGIRMGLEQSGFTVDWVRDGVSAGHAITSDDFDLMLLDLGLPRQDGLTLLKKLRKAGKELPVLVVTARDAVEDRVTGLDCGADDYVVKPFDLDELAARVRAITRRRSGRATPLLRHGDIILNPAARSVTRNGDPVPCTTHEFAILEALLTQAGRVLTRERLEDVVYGWAESVESNTIEVHIHHLRKKLGKDLIQTVRGVGYIIPKSGARHGG
ncbi:MAG TPA: response regulator [Sedimenticola sp.]|nr:response regulator [Sedimenticola sp.]